MQYHAPASTSEAVKLLAGSKGKTFILAGGTDLLVRMRGGYTEPDTVIDIKRIGALKKISRAGKGWRIGAAVSAAEMSEDAALKAAWPGVVEAANLIGSTQIQGRATIAGNLCNASPAADSVPAMAAAGAKAVVAGPGGKRRIPVEKLVKGPGKLALKKAEFVEAIELPEKKKRTGDAYLRFIPRTEMDIAVVGVGICLTLDSKGKCTAARVALGAVGPTVIVSDKAARALVGTTIDDDALQAFSKACEKEAKPIDDKRGTREFRKHITGVLARRAAIIARDRAKEKA
jgi:CO/xanthine dehydrogenase FAD-binding subunit